MASPNFPQGWFQLGNGVRTALSLGLLSVFVAGSLPLPAFSETVTPKVTEFKLPTGQTLLIKEDHSKPIVTIDTWVKTGSVNETPSINGVSHFLEHLLFKGTSQHKPGEIDRLLEARGSEFNAATSDDFTHFYITTATPYFEETLKLHADMMLNASIPAGELPQERKVVQEEINRADDHPDRQMYIALAQQMYATHGYGLDTLGPKENIANIPRKSILAYYHYWYQPQNFNTVIVGDVDPGKVKQLVLDAFPAPHYQVPKDFQPPVVGAVQPIAHSAVKVMENPNLTQDYFSLAFLGPAQQKPEDVYALDIATLALGSGKSSRLYQALRERKPLATSVSAANYTQKYAGLIVIDTEAPLANRDAVKQEVLAQLKDLKANGITQAELDKAKTQYLKDFTFENETTDGTAASIGYNVTIGSLADYQNHVSNVEKVTLENVRDALNRYLDLNRAVIVELVPTSAKVDLKAATDANLALLKDASASAAQMAAAPAPAMSAAEKAQQQPVRKTLLPNGMTLLSKPLKDSSTVAIKLFVKGGQGVETIPGTATLVASMLMQGTQSRSAETISRELESKGMNLSIGADDDYVEVTGTAIHEDLGELFTLLKDVMTNPTFSEAEILKKKAQLKQAIDASRDNPSSVAFENLGIALYPNHAYGNKGKRIEEHLDQITRQDLLDYYGLYFEPQNMVVSVVGNFDPDTLTSYLTSLYPECLTCRKSLVSIPPAAPLLESKAVVEEKPKLSAVWLAQGWLVPPISHQKDYVTLKVINSLVGTGMSSRLFVDLREKQGLAYVVGSMYPTRAQDSRFAIYIGTDPANTDKVKQGFQQEIKRLQTEPVSPAELATAKSKLIGGFALAHDSNVNQAFYLGLYEVLGAGYQFDARYPSLVEQVSAEDIRQSAQKVFSSPSVLSLVQPTAKSKASVEASKKTGASQ